MSEPEDNEPSPPEQDPPAQEPAVGVDQLLEQIAESLRQRHGKEAVRLFLEGQAQGLIPAHEDQVHWLIERLGEDSTRRLIAAFAHFPCAACNGGLETCPACDGTGVRAEGLICEACLGGGRARCDFCAGSGLATYNLFPPPLRRYTITHRVHMARRELEKLPAVKLPSDARSLLNLVLSGNKLWCVLENAVTAAKAFAAERPSAASNMNELIAACRASAVELERFIRGVLIKLAEAFESASHASGEVDSEQAQANRLRADFHRTLAEAVTFERTLLHHPLVDERD